MARVRDVRVLEVQSGCPTTTTLSATIHHFSERDGKRQQQQSVRAGEQFVNREPK